MKNSILNLLIFFTLIISIFQLNAQSISWDNSISPFEVSPGETINLQITYDTAGNSLNYIWLQLQHFNSSWGVENNYNSVFYNGVAPVPNQDTINLDYTIPDGIPMSSELPAGDFYYFKFTMWTSAGWTGLDLFPTIVAAQVTTKEITVNLNAKHIVGGIETFERAKFISIHSDQSENEWNGSNFTSDLRDDFLNGYDVYLGRNTGHITWNLNQMEQDPTRPGYANPSEIASKGLLARNNYDSQISLHEYENRNNLIIAGQLHPFWTGTGQQTTSQGWSLANATATGEYMGRYINEFHGGNGQPEPAWVEVINEPAYESLGGPSDFNNNIQEIADFHNEVALAIKAQAPNTLVGGYTTAFPNFEVGNFQRWQNRWKLFMDVAGNNMDFWSIHLYDFPAIGGQKRLRSGSNLEATFDMMEQYSSMSFGEVKPFVISEYGAQMHDYHNQQWSPYRDWLHIAASNKMLMSFMERPNSIASAINFIIVKAEWGYSNGIPYYHRLMRKENEPNSYTGQWVYTDMVKFYQLWSDVNGTRVDSVSEDLDLQVDAYVENDIAYVIVNNLNFNSEVFDLNLVENEGATITAINKKYLYEDSGNPILLEESVSVNESSFSLAPESTMILEYTFDSDIFINESNTETKHYATTYLKPILANQTENFTLNNISKNNFGEAILRVGIGRPHGLSLQPTILINNIEIDVPTNWRGDNQSQRDTFYGVLEIPVSFDVLQNNNNTVSITFPDNGGHISTVTMQLFNFSSNLRNITLSSNDLNLETFKSKVYPNPTNGIIDIKGTIPITEISIFSITGKLIKTYNNTNSIDISNLDEGMYFLEINKTETKKIIKN